MTPDPDPFDHGRRCPDCDLTTHAHDGTRRVCRSCGQLVPDERAQFDALRRRFGRMIPTTLLTHADR